MKSVLKRFSGDKKETKDSVKSDSKGGQTFARRQNDSQEKNQRVNQKPKDTVGQKPVQKSARNVQSALRPGNNSGIQKQKEHPLVQFGPILKEFLASKELVNKSINVRYEQSNDKFDIAVSFKTVLPNGVSTSNQTSMNIENYLAERKSLLKVKDDSSHYVGFVEKLIERLGVDLSKAKPCVTFRSVETFVLKHMSPVEKGIIHLTKDEYDRIDTGKIPAMMEPTYYVIKKHYGSIEARTKFIISQINSSDATADKEPPNWVLDGVAGLSKGALLEALKLQHVPKVTKEQKAILESLATSLLTPDLTEEEKNSSHASDKEETVDL